MKNQLKAFICLILLVAMPSFADKLQAINQPAAQVTITPSKETLKESKALFSIKKKSEKNSTYKALNNSELIQNVFLKHLHHAFHLVTHYAMNLLYIFVTFEIVIFGLAWALQQSTAWEQLFFKIIKIALIFFLITHYQTILDTLMNSFSQISENIAQTPKLGSTLLNPVHLWQFGYSAGLSLLKAASLSNGIALPLIEITLGIGILLVFALLGIQLITQFVAFYFVALSSLILLPLGTFQITVNFFEQSMHAVIKAGVRVMVLISIVGIAMNTWQSFHSYAFNPHQSINAPLGLFFSGLLFLCLSITLPTLAANAVGEIRLKRNFQTSPNITHNTNTLHSGSSLQASSLRTTAQLSTHLSTEKNNTTTSTSSHASNTNVITSRYLENNIASSPEQFLLKLNKKQNKPSQQENISEEDLNKIKKIFLESLEEKKKDKQ